MFWASFLFERRKNKFSMKFLLEKALKLKNVKIFKSTNPKFYLNSRQNFGVKDWISKIFLSSAFLTLWFLTFFIVLLIAFFIDDFWGFFDYFYELTLSSFYRKSWLSSSFNIFVKFCAFMTLVVQFFRSTHGFVQKICQSNRFKMCT